MKPKSRKQMIIELLNEKGRAVSIEELSDNLNLPQNKIRQSLSTFERDIVRVGHKLFDLPNRTLQGKIFRYSPTQPEYEKSVLIADEDIFSFLTGCRDYWNPINLIDSLNRTYQLSRAKPTRHIQFYHYRGATKLFKNLALEKGDDLLFTCLDLSTNTFLVTHQKRAQRKTLEITVRNRQLCDTVYDILLHAYCHYEDSLFLIRKYLFIYSHFTDPPPDNLRIALSSDARFLITPRDKMLSWSGYPFTHREMTVGLKKYFLKNDTNEYIPVFIDTDDECGGKVAHCTECDERLVWKPDTGWRHTVDDVGWVDTYVPKEFFKKENSLIIH